MGFCGEMRLGRDAGERDGLILAKTGDEFPAPKPCRRPLENQKKNYRLQNTSF